MTPDNDPPGSDDPFFRPGQGAPFGREPYRNPFKQHPTLPRDSERPPSDRLTEVDAEPVREVNIVDQYRTSATANPVEPEWVRPVSPSEPVLSEPEIRPAPPRSGGGFFNRGPSAASPPEPPPPPPGSKKRPVKRSERSRGTFITGANWAITLLIVVLFTAAAAVHYGQKEFDAPGPLQAETDLAVPRGSGPRDIAERLQQAGAIGAGKMSYWFFVAGTRMTGSHSKLQAGEYRIPAAASMRQIVEMISGGNVIEHTVTVPEGLTSKQIVTRLMGESLLTGTVREVPPEGTLLPETYKVQRGTERQALLDRMAKDQTKLLNEIWAKRNQSVPVKSPIELVTLASIVEKETGIASERPRVASVFVNRLNKKMRLQSDPTIIYGLVQGAGTLGRPILRSEITKPTPYNTYVIPALPPGPIANPGRASLEAAANPMKTNDVYFVADGSGGHAFASTLAEHNANVTRWRALDKADNDRAPADAANATEPGAAAPPTAPPAN
ncbi:hypothetical protein IZ6_15840 [Terrihabitans soli]|uniref:Endolytic murein transglycosylase n=1 Tax=Terrihabitans soli TaxID=708113 RepID=A0A6S6QPD7_9HYPH|nr:endolytic transglycosylase MltG [Terrihabitans soli]BCJ90849.1 hypothetical protein IZ6_15840 [Terrihabitans soli]